MPVRLLQTVPFDTSTDIGNGTGTVAKTLDAIDFSQCDELRLVVVCTKADTDAGDTLNVYLQNRWADGVWIDRIAAHQLIGSLSPTTNSPEVREYNLQQFGTFTDSEEGDEPYGSAGASHMTAGTVRNGAFAPRYRNTSSTDAGWRIWLDQTNTSTSDADFEGTIYIYGNTAV